MKIRWRRLCVVILHSGFRNELTFENFYQMIFLQANHRPGVGKIFPENINSLSQKSSHYCIIHHQANSLWYYLTWHKSPSRYSIKVESLWYCLARCKTQTRCCIQSQLAIVPKVNLLLCQEGGEDPQNALSCRSLSAKEPLIIGLFDGKWPVKIRHPMHLGPVCNIESTCCCNIWHQVNLLLYYLLSSRYCNI